MSGEQFVEAIMTLRGMSGLDLTPRQKLDHVTMLADVYRAIGLPERAATAVRSGIDSIADESMRSTLRPILASCHVDEGDLDAARAVLAEVLMGAGAGEQSQAAACLLAEICLDMGKYAQAANLADEVLKTRAAPETRTRARELLGSANLALHRYDQAIRALAGIDVSAQTMEAPKQ
jgi:lipopolysaccharide biosynthesis regulator YciM